MVSPRIKALPSASPSSTTETSKRRILSSRRGNGGDNATEKGNYSGYVDRMRSSPPSTPIPVHFISEMLEDSAPDMRDVMGFRAAGFMDETEMFRKDKEALDHSGTKLQSEESLVMVSSQIKALPSASPSKTIETSKRRVLSSRRGDGSRITTRKGNSSGYIDRMGSPSHTPLPVHLVSEMLEDCTPDTRDVIGLREAGFIDEPSVVSKDKEALHDNVTKLQSEELLMMVSPQIKALPSASPSPTIETSKHRVVSSRRGDGSRITTQRGNSSGYIDRIRSPPHTPLPVHFVSAMLEDCTPDTRDVIEFRDAGFMDEATMVRKDKEALEDSVTKLQSELYDYQLNMGHLLINKADLITQCDDLKHHLEETKESLKRERSAHIIDLREAEDRMDSLREALFLEKQTVVNLERDLFVLDPENSSLSKETLEEKAAGDFLCNPDFDDIDKLRSADVISSEANKMNLNFDIQLPEMENPESVLKKDREAHDAMIINPREDIQEWENKLQEREHKLSEGLQNLNVMEEKAKKMQISLDEREQLCKKTHEEIGLERMDLKKKENDVNHKLAEISVKEQEIENLKKSLDKREKDLLTFEENINFREKVGIESVLEEHRSLQEKKKVEMEMEMEQRKASVEKECREMLDSAEKKELKISNLEEELLERRLSLDAKAEHLREKDELSGQLIHSLEDKKHRLEAEEKALNSEKETLLRLQLELESQQAAAAELEVNLRREQLLLTAATKEQSDQSLLLENLKQELEKLMFEKTEISNRVEEKRTEKERLEKKVAELSERKTAVGEEVGVLAEEKKSFENKRAADMEEAKQIRDALEAEKAEMTLRKKLLEEGMEELRILKEKVEDEKAEMASRKKLLEEGGEELRIFKEKVEDEKAEMTSRKKLLEEGTEELRILKEKLEDEKAEMTSRKKLLEDGTEELRILKEKLEDEKAEMTLRKKLLEDGTEEMRILKEKLEDEKAEMTLRKKLLEDGTEEMRILKEKLDDEKSTFLNERGRFLSFLGKHELCPSCGQLVREFSKLTGGTAGSESETASWLRECTASAIDQEPEVLEVSIEGEEKEVGRKTRPRKKNTAVIAHEKQMAPATDDGGRKRKQVRESTEGGEGSREAEVHRNAVGGQPKKQVVPEKRTAEGAAEEPATKDDGIRGRNMVSGKRKRVQESTEGGEGSGEVGAHSNAAGGRPKKQVVLEPTAAETRYNLRTSKSGVTTRAQRKKG